jgi:hypothetical protein
MDGLILNGKRIFVFNLSMSFLFWCLYAYASHAGTPTAVLVILPSLASILFLGSIAYMAMNQSALRTMTSTLDGP